MASKCKAPQATVAPPQAALSLHSPAGPGKSFLTLLVTGASLIPTREEQREMHTSHSSQQEGEIHHVHPSRALRKSKAKDPQAFTAPTVNLRLSAKRTALSFPVYPAPSKNRHSPPKGTQPTHSPGSQDHSCLLPKPPPHLRLLGPDEAKTVVP